MIIGLTHKAVAHLATAIADDATLIAVHPTEYEPILSAAPGDYVYLLIRGPANRELVKVTIDWAAWGGYLTIARGQGGTTARAWPVGSMLFATTHADHYNLIVQRAGNRVIDYNPNEILSPTFAGEKVYQSGPAGCERWWKSYNAVDPYWSLITGAACANEAYADIGFDYDLLIYTAPPADWTSYLNYNYWENDENFYWFIWEWEPQEEWRGQFQQINKYDGQLLPVGSWATDFRAGGVRLTLGAGSLDPRYDQNSGPISMYLVLDDGGPGELVEIPHDGGASWTWTLDGINSNSGDIIGLQHYVANRANLDTNFYIENIEFKDEDTGGGVWGTGGGGGEG